MPTILKDAWAPRVEKFESGASRERFEFGAGRKGGKAENRESEGLLLGWTKDGRRGAIRSASERGGRMQGAINSEIALAR